MNLIASSSSSPVWLIALVIVVILIFQWAAMLAHKAEIRNEVDRLKAKLLSVQWKPFYGFGDSNDTFYDVTMELPSGKRVSAICKCNLWHGVYWKSTPWSQELLREPTQPPPAEFPPPSARVTADCSRCGYGLQEGWKVCPNCGTEVGASA